MQTPVNSESRFRVLIILVCLIFAGEMIFSLPFHVARFFRPTFLSAFDLSNAQLGDVFAVYGVTAMLAYFPGGVIADRFSGRVLMTCSLILTALGGVWFAQIPGPQSLMLLFGYWGITSILLFWAAMIKVTREVGGEQLQGRAFGVLDGGRGLIAAAVASLGVLLLGQILPEDPATLSVQDRQIAIKQVIYFYTAGTILAAILVWLVLPKASPSAKQSSLPLKEIPWLLARPGFWLISLVVICAYCGFKGIDNYGLYAAQALGMNDLEAAQFTSSMAYVRPVVAVLAGVAADRIYASRTIVIGFSLMLLAYAVLSLASPNTIGQALLITNLIVSACGVFAIRAVYFALLQEQRLPLSITGTAVGLISVIGFTPDIFFAPIAGRLLDASPGIAGHQDFFMLLSVISIFGLISASMLLRQKRQHAK